MAALDPVTFEKLKKHPMLVVDQSEFATTFNLSKFLGNVAMGVLTALVVRQVLKFIDDRKEMKGKVA